MSGNDSAVAGNEPASNVMDAQYAYKTFLGRDAEAREVLLEKTGQPIGGFSRAFLASQEFLNDVATPIMGGLPMAADRFQVLPSRRLKLWLATRLLTTPHAGQLARIASDWTEIYEALVVDEVIFAILEDVLTAEGAQALKDGLGLRTGEFCSATLSNVDTRRLRHGPTFSLLLPLVRWTSQDLAPILKATLDQTYPNWELVLVDGAPLPSGEGFWMDALSMLDSRIKVADVPGGMRSVESATLAAYDLSSGEYFTVLTPEDVLEGNVLDLWARIATAHGRPEIIRFPKNDGALETETVGYLIRSDTAARAGLFQGGDSRHSLAERAMAQGASLYTASRDGIEPQRFTDAAKSPLSMASQ